MGRTSNWGDIVPLKTGQIKLAKLRFRKSNSPWAAPRVSSGSARVFIIVIDQVFIIVEIPTKSPSPNASIQGLGGHESILQRHGSARGGSGTFNFFLNVFYRV